MIRVGGKQLLVLLTKKLLVKLIPYILTVLAITALFFFIICVLFVLPKFIVENIEAEAGSVYKKTVAIFNTGKKDDWQLSDDQKLYEKYFDLEQDWLNQFISQQSLNNSKIDFAEGNVADENATVEEIWARFYDSDSGLPAERTQAKLHHLSWALLAAVDRVLGDPIVSGSHERQPNPEGHFKKLEPIFTWQEFELFYRCTWSETSADGQGSDTMTKTYRHKIRLLAEVESYEAKKITYDWDRKRYFFKDTQTGFVEEAYYPVMIGSKQQGPYYEKLRKLLVENQLVKESDLELVINLAINYDEEFKYNTSYLSGNITELFMDTENSLYFTTDTKGRYTWPTGEYGTITSAYGWRYHPVLGDLKFHKGIDISCPRGTPILSAWKGKVIMAGWVSGYGRAVMVNHGDYKTLYAHLDSIAVKPGQEVERGQIIGKADSTGLSTGDHLHFEIRSGNGETSYLDPITVYKDKGGY